MHVEPLCVCVDYSISLLFSCLTTGIVWSHNVGKNHLKKDPVLKIWLLILTHFWKEWLDTLSSQHSLINSALYKLEYTRPYSMHLN